MITGRLQLQLMSEVRELSKLNSVTRVVASRLAFSPPTSVCINSSKSVPSFDSLDEPQNRTAMVVDHTYVSTCLFYPSPVIANSPNIQNSSALTDSCEARKTSVQNTTQAAAACCCKNRFQADVFNAVFGCKFGITVRDFSCILLFIEPHWI